MNVAARDFGARDGRLFPEGRLSGPMPWVIAIMMFLTALAAAAGLGLAAGAERIEGQIGNRVTVQIVEANPELRDRQTAAVAALLERAEGVTRVRPVPEEELDQLLEPWLGASAATAELPVPALIDVDLDAGGRSRLPQLREAVQEVAPAAVVSDVADWLQPFSGLLASLQWLAAGLVGLMIAATAATVVLAARASLNTHSQTIEILHLMGATDQQIARMFQRRIALDVLFGGIVGAALAILVLVLIGGRVAAIGSELLGSIALPDHAWAVLALLPFAGAALALLVARITIQRALGRML
ncbi:MAG: cell division protein FtsX [Allosphingosinicella sp.]|uniref:cell division protein FtsX n=1 Tax=Allosphingosinicella sp. TaxID=2823234 RepID=UPI003944F49C